MFQQANSLCQAEPSSDVCCSSSEGNCEPPCCDVSLESESHSEVSEIDGFIETLRRDMQVLEVKVNREDSLTVASVAYRVKSTAKALGILSIHRSADQIETCARRNQIAQLTAEIDLMRHQVELFVRSCGQEKHPELTGADTSSHC